MESVIQVEQLTKRFGTLTAVNRVSFQVTPGEVFGILGPNGAGKTTLLECIEGLQEPNARQARAKRFPDFVSLERRQPWS